MKKRILAGVLGLTMLLTACGGGTSSSPAASTPASSAPAAAASGTFEGSSVGMQGTVTVAMTVEDGKITNVELTECHETPSIASVAMERLPQLMVEHQTTTLDNVTGATLASGAIMRAASAAAEAAGLDMDQLKANAYSEPAGEDETWDTDVLVVGGGGAGFSSAITAAQEGADVILIEKSSVLGGNTLMQGGAFNAVDTVAQSEVVLTEAQKGTLDSYLALSTDDPDLHFDQFPEWAEVLTQLQSDINQFYAENAGTTAGVDMPGFDSVALHMWHIYVGGLRQLNDGTWICSDIDLARNLAESALGTFEWMRDGLGLNAPSGEGAGSDLFTVLGAMWPRTHPVETSTELIDKLRDVAEAAGVTIYTETAATSLLTDDTGRVIGATAEQANGTKITINTTKGVVLASGGYCANPAMVKEYDKYWGDDLSDHTLTTNVGTNEGDGIVMAQAIGADVVGMEVAQMMPSSSPLKGTMTDGAWGDASEQIWIDGEGNRFVDEYAERDVLAKASLQLEDGIFYIIYAGTNRTSTGDTTVKGASLDDVMFGTTIQDMVDNGHVWYGDTLAELAEATATSAGGAAPAFTEEALRNTIEKYNSYVEAQEDPDFHKEVLAGAIDIEAIDADPNVGYVISPRKASLHHTMGGLKIDTEAQVINTEGEVIPGLWAAGEVTGGIHAGNRLGGNAVADIFTYGHIAGANAAAGN